MGDQDAGAVVFKPTALLSVYEKAGIVEFAEGLVALGWRILASGGTAAALTKAGVPVTDVAGMVGGGAILGHKVVTLSREVHAGLLADLEKDRDEMQQLGLPYIHLVCVDLYPLQAEIANPEATPASVIAKTDIGGPTMLRSAAKGRRVVVCDPADRPRVLAWLREGRPNNDVFVTALCAKAEYVVADYCLASAGYHGGGEFAGLVGRRVATCKYGENAWQQPAALYATDSSDALAVSRCVVVEGTPLSFNNCCDIDRLFQTTTHVVVAIGPFGHVAVAGKHGNPVGVCAYGVVNDEDRTRTVRADILRKMVMGDPRAIFGGLVMVTFEIDEEYAEILLTHASTSRRLLDAIIAPGFTPGAIAMLRRKGDKCRFVVNPALRDVRPSDLDHRLRVRFVRGGFLAQPNYTQVPDWAKLDLAREDYLDIRLAWAIGATSNSNTVTLVKDGMLIGNGVGQQDRVGCCELAVKRARDAGHDPRGAVAYSDSFFPFKDGPEVLIQAGVRAIMATTGSVKDEDVAEVCRKHAVRLYRLPDAEARGFFGH